ncbi:WD40-repeat-containing domain protein [Dipodascopsis uninucleata]
MNMSSSPSHPGYPPSACMNSGSRLVPATSDGDCQKDVKENAFQTPSRTKTYEQTRLSVREDSCSSSVCSSPLAAITDSSALNSRAEQSTNRTLLTPETTPRIKKIKLLEDHQFAAGVPLQKRLFERELVSRKFYSRADFMRELRTVYSKSNDIYRLKSRNSSQSLTLPFTIASFHQSPFVAIGDESGCVRILDTDRENFDQAQLNIICHDNAIFDLEFSIDDRLFATSSGDQTARVFDLQAHKCLSILRPMDGNSVKQVKFSPDNSNILATSTRGGTISLFDLRVSLSASIMPMAQIVRAHNPIKGRKAKLTHARSVTALEFLGHNALISAGESNGVLRQWDIRKMSLEKKFIQPSNETKNNSEHGITSIVIDEPGSRIWSLSRNNCLYSYPLGKIDSSPLEILRNKRLKVDSFYIKAAVGRCMNNSYTTQNYIACGSSDNCIVAFPTSTRGKGDMLFYMSKNDNREVGVPINGHKKEVTGIAWTTDGKLISIGDDMIARRWQFSGDERKANEIRSKRNPCWWNVDEFGISMEGCAE